MIFFVCFLFCFAILIILSDVEQQQQWNKVNCSKYQFDHLNISDMANTMMSASLPALMVLKKVRHTY